MGTLIRPSAFRREKNNVRGMIDLKKCQRFKDLFSVLREEHPQVIRHLLHDLSNVKGYTENEIAFAIGIPIPLIRKILAGDISHVNRDIFLSIISLYARVFCGWCLYHEY